MAKYVDGFVIPIPKKNLAKYRKIARIGCKVWMKHGALDYYECAGDDIKNSHCGLGFPKMCKLKPSETVVFAFIVYKNKAHRNKVNKKVVKEMGDIGGEWAMPFDMKRFVFGGFKVIVEAK